MFCAIWHRLYNFENENFENHLWRSITFSKVAGQKLNGTKSRNASHILITPKCSNCDASSLFLKLFSQ